MSADDPFRSSDSIRSGSALRHARVAHFETPLALERGGELAPLRVVYETWGTLAPDRSNAILVCHAISGDSHAARHDAHDEPGWWDALIGPGRAVDTRRFFVICPNVLGGCRGTTGPGDVDPRTGRPWGASFPVVTVGDIVALHLRLLDQLGIERLHAAIGGSLGGHQVLDLATRAPERVAGAVVVASSPRLTSQALAFDVVGRNAIRRDPHYGADGAAPGVGLAIARMLGHVTYLSREAMLEKFDATRNEPHTLDTLFENEFSVGSYLAHQGEKFVERFDAHSYVTLSMAMDLFDLGSPAARLRERLGRSRCRWLVVSFSSDWLFPPEQSREIVDALLAVQRPVASCEIASRCGHDAFLLEDDLPRYGPLIEGFLAQPDPARPGTSGAPLAEDPRTEERRRAIHMMRPRRIDYDRIAELVKPGESVLDLGCGAGGLLARLRSAGAGRCIGIERDEEDVIVCVRRGLDVVHGDIEVGLACFRDDELDVVVLSQTLQAAHDVERLLAELLRVGRRGIVSFPNVAHAPLRERLARDGRAPVPSVLGPERWWDTPNIRALSILDFEDFCAERGVRVLERRSLDSTTGRLIHDDPNRNADLALFVIARPLAGTGGAS